MLRMVKFVSVGGVAALAFLAALVPYVGQGPGGLPQVWHEGPTGGEDPSIPSVPVTPPAGSVDEADPSDLPPDSVPGQDPAVSLPAPSAALRREAFGLCPGAPPSGGGMQRRPDTARDTSGNLHMVWAERFDGQFDLCYARKNPGREMGVGSQANPAFRITATPGDSVSPQVAIDPVSGLVYVLWTEVQHAVHGSNTMTPKVVLDYVASDVIDPANGRMELVGGRTLVGTLPCTVKRFEVRDAAWEIEFRAGTPDWIGALGPGDALDVPCGGNPSDLPPMDWKGTFDTDRDGWRDSIEITCPPFVPGFPPCPDPIKPFPCPDWASRDSDFDWIPDPEEFRRQFDPCLRIDLEFPFCFPFPLKPECGDIVIVLCTFADPDADGIGTCDEGRDYPVTTEVAEFLGGHFATYRFWPKVNGLHNLTLRTQQRTFIDFGNCTNVSIAISFDDVPSGTWTRAWLDATPWVWSIDTVATVTLSGIDFTGVTPSMAVDVRLAVSFDPPGCEGGLLAVFRALALDWLKLELASNRAEVNYKDADDFLAASGHPTVILHADFDTDSLNLPPSAWLPREPPGDRLQLNTAAGSILVKGSIGGLTSQPVEASMTGGTGGVDVQGFVAGQPPTFGRWTASWRSLAKSGSVCFASMTFRDSSANIIAALEYRPSGILDFNDLFTATGIGVAWTADVAQNFELTVDLSAKATSLSIDGAPVATAQSMPFYQIAAANLNYMGLEIGCTTSQGYALDDMDIRAIGLGGPFALPIVTEDMVIHLDPEQRDLLFELDSMAGHDWPGAILNEVINAFSDLNIVMNYRISETGLPATGAGATLTVEGFTFTDTNEASVYLDAHRDATLQALGYVHVINVNYISLGCGIVELASAGGAPEFSGALLPDQSFLDGACAGSTMDLFSARLAVFLHEVGHALNAAHDLTSGTLDPLCVIDDCDATPDDLCNAYNVMAYTYCFPTTNVFYGTGNFDRRAGATGPIGRPRFSYESLAQFDFTSLLSVGTGNNIDLLGDFV